MSIRHKIWERLAFNGLVEGDYAKSEKYFLKIARSRPGSPGTDYNLGLVRLAAGDFEAAESHLLKDLQLFGESFRRFLTLGDLYYIWGRREAAGEYYAKALEDSEQQETGRLLRERIQKCSSPPAFENVNRAHRRFEEGITLQKQGDLSGAESAFSEAVSLDGTHYQAWNNLGCLYLDFREDPEEAVRCFSAASAYSRLPSIRMNLNRANELMNKHSSSK